MESPDYEDGQYYNPDMEMDRDDRVEPARDSQMQLREAIRARKQLEEQNKRLMDEKIDFMKQRAEDRRQFEERWASLLNENEVLRKKNAALLNGKEDNGSSAEVLETLKVEKELLEKEKGRVSTDRQKLEEEKKRFEKEKEKFNEKKKVFKNERLQLKKDVDLLNTSLDQLHLVKAKFEATEEENVQLRSSLEEMKEANDGLAQRKEKLETLMKETAKCVARQTQSRTPGERALALRILKETKMEDEYEELLFQVIEQAEYQESLKRNVVEEENPAKRKKAGEK